MNTGKKSESGYVLLLLLLTMALLAVAAGVAASSIAFTIRRDREEELIHRGVQYKRAIREFTKKTGRFPVRLEELEQSEGRRFLRHRYKDPITGKDFKLVYMKDVQLYPNLAPKLNPDPAPRPGGNGSIPESGTPSTSADGSDPQSDPNAAQKTTAQLPNASAIPASSGGQPIIGGLIVGVVSASTEQTIREFNKKKHYNEWRFYYDTAFDNYFLQNAPTERSLVQPTAPIAGSGSQPTTAPTQQPPPQPSQGMPVQQ